MSEHAHGPGHGHVHGHHGHHDPETWAKKLDDPARDEWQKPAEVVAALALEPGMVVADVGAGTGYFESHLGRAVGPSGKVLALDFDPDLVAHVEKRCAKAKLGNVEARLVAPDDPRLAAASVDRLLLVDSWHHLADRVAYAKKLRSALRPGGRIVIVDHVPDAPEGPPPEMRVRTAEVVAELDAAGFRSRVVPDSLPRHFIVVGS